MGGPQEIIASALMSSWTGVIIFVVAIVIAIVIGEKFKVNSGIIALAFAGIIGACFCNMRLKEVVALFPIDTFYLLFITTFFYGFMSEIGFIKGISDRMMYACRNKPAFVPIMTLIITFVISALGGDQASMLIMAPIAFGFAIEMGFNPILAIIAVQGGGSLGGYMPWATVGALQISLFERPFGSHAPALAAQMGFVITVAITVLILFFAYYFITKGFKVKSAVTVKPEPFNKKQKVALGLMIGVIVCLVLFPLINMIFKGTVVFSFLTRVLDIRLVMTIAAIIAIFLRFGNEREILMKKVPWGLIFMVCGMMTLINLMSDPHVGTIDFVTGLVGEGINPTIVVLILFLAVCGLGAVTGGITIISLLLAVVPVLAPICGMEAWALMACGMCGIHGMSISPYSAGGAMALSGCPEEMKSKVVRQQYLVMFIQAAILLIFTLIGLPKLFGGWFL